MVPAASDRKIYPYSVVSGGVYSGEEAIYRARADGIVQRHYVELDLASMRVEYAKVDLPRYASYRIGDEIFWTKKPLMVRAGEAMLSDGVNAIRSRCGNRLSVEPREPTTDQEPNEEEFELPQSSTYVPFAAQGPFPELFLLPMTNLTPEPEETKQEQGNGGGSTTASGQMQERAARGALLSLPGGYGLIGFSPAVSPSLPPGSGVTPPGSPSQTGISMPGTPSAGPPYLGTVLPIPGSPGPIFGPTGSSPTTGPSTTPTGPSPGGGGGGSPPSTASITSLTPPPPAPLSAPPQNQPGPGSSGPGPGSPSTGSGPGPLTPQSFSSDLPSVPEPGGEFLCGTALLLLITRQIWLRGVRGRGR